MDNLGAERSYIKKGKREVKKFLLLFNGLNKKHG